MFIVTKIETHRDRFIDDIFGPFETYDAAYEFAQEMERRSDNFNGVHRLYNFRAWPLSNPRPLTGN